MWSVFIKEWRQNRHSTTFGVLLIIAAVAEIMAGLAIYAPVSTIDSASTAAENIVATVQVINGLFAVILIAMAGNRWRNERGDASLDIVNTTPLTPLQIAMGKLLATASSVWVLNLICLPLPAFYFRHSWLDYLLNLPMTVLCGLAFSALVLGFCAFNSSSRQRSGGDWGTMLAILLSLPLITVANFNADEVGYQALYRSCLLSAATVFVGIGLMIAAIGNVNSNRVMPLKTIILLEALLLVPAYQSYDYLIGNGVKFQLIDCLSGYEIVFFVAADLMVIFSLCERVKQSRRVLKYHTGKLLFPLYSGAANSIIMALIYALAGYLIGQMDCMDSACSCGIREFLIWQFVLVFFYASVAQYLKHLTDKSAMQVNRLAAFMVVMFCCWLPCVLSFCWDGMEEYLNLLTPWYLLFADFNGYLCIGLLVVSALLVLPLIAREVGAVYNAQETEK